MPELRTDALINNLEKIFNYLGRKVWLHVPAGVYIDRRTNDFHYKSDNKMIDKNSIFSIFSRNKDLRKFDFKSGFHYGFPVYDFINRTIWLNSFFEPNIKPSRTQNALSFPIVCEFPPEIVNPPPPPKWQSDFKTNCLISNEKLRNQYNNSLTMVDSIQTRYLFHEPETLEEENLEVQFRKRSLWGMGLKLASKTLLKTAAAKGIEMILDGIISNSGKLSHEQLSQIDDADANPVDTIADNYNDRMNLLRVRINQVISNATQDKGSSIDLALSIQRELALQDLIVESVNIQNEAVQNILQLIINPNDISNKHLALPLTTLQNISTAFLLSHHKALDSRYENIKSTLVYDKAYYYILNLVPIRTDEAQQTLYRIFPIPVYDSNSTYYPLVPYEYMAVSINSDDVTPMTSFEMTKCLTTSTCTAAAPTYGEDYPICGASNYFENVDVCVYRKVEGLTPYFSTHGNFTFYSLPENLTLDIHCYGKSYAMAGFDRKLELPKGLGKFSLPIGCRAEMDDFTIRASRDYLSSEFQTSKPKIPIEEYASTYEVKLKQPEFAKEPNLVNSLIKKVSFMNMLLYIIPGATLISIFLVLMIVLMCFRQQISTKLKIFRILKRELIKGKSGVFPRKDANNQNNGLMNCFNLFSSCCKTRRGAKYDLEVARNENSIFSRDSIGNPDAQ